MRITPAILTCLLVASCATPPGPPVEVGMGIVTALDAGDVPAAEAQFARVARDAKYRQRIYPVLYDEARDRYASGNVAAAVPLLRFLSDQYSSSVAAPEALLYALFLQRSRQDQVDPRLTVEIDTVLATLRERREDLPAWVALVDAQQSIDRGDVEVARAAFERFESQWDGQPAALAIYVDDLQRYLSER